MVEQVKYRYSITVGSIFDVENFDKMKYEIQILDHLI